MPMLLESYGIQPQTYLLGTQGFHNRWMRGTLVCDNSLSAMQCIIDGCKSKVDDQCEIPKPTLCRRFDLLGDLSNARASQWTPIVAKSRLAEKRGPDIGRIYEASFQVLKSLQKLGQ